MPIHATFAFQRMSPVFYLHKIWYMKNIFFLVILTVVMFSCNDKEDIPPPQPEPETPMLYTDLANREVKRGPYQGIDADNNGSLDFAFYVLPIGDPILKQDKFRFLLASSINSLLFVDGDNLSPIREKGHVIKTGNELPFEWFEVSEVFLAEKIVEDNNSFHWEGPWKNVDHKYISIQIKKTDGRYNGWIEFSFDTNNEKIILHKAAISKEANKEVKIK
jgi:hypothetical protein